MCSLKSPLTVLLAAASQFSDRPAFRIAKASEINGRVHLWVTITYRQFLSDVDNSGRYWYKKLTTDGLAQGSVVGIW